MYARVVYRDISRLPFGTPFEGGWVMDVSEQEVTDNLRVTTLSLTSSQCVREAIEVGAAFPPSVTV